ncbi:MAG: gamma carbonic anhydrase family protein [Candidatus Izemoplasmatales bacterium]|nr:gamma carbonic anhydrase family protein [Candidatus Izemoplasmatales bacterium]
MKHIKYEPLIDSEALNLGAEIIGEVIIEKDVNMWFNATIRGDMAKVTIKEGTNIQDNVVVHTNTDAPTYIGKMVTVGHSAIIHAATVGNYCLIGMGSIILDKAVIGDYALVAAGTLVPPGKVVPPRTLVMGNPMRIIRELTEEEIEANIENSRKYIKLAREYYDEKNN